MTTARPTPEPDTSTERPDPRSPQGWAVTVVRVVETTVYDIPVAHPADAEPSEIAVVAYDDYSSELHPDRQFTTTAAPDQIEIADQRMNLPSTALPSWNVSRPRPDDPSSLLGT